MAVQPTNQSNFSLWSPKVKFEGQWPFQEVKVKTSYFRDVQNFGIFFEIAKSVFTVLSADPENFKLLS